MFFSSFYVRKGRRSYVFLFSLQRNSSLVRFFCKQEKKKEKKKRWLSLWHLILRSVEQLKKEMSLTQHHLIYIFIKFNAGLSKKILKSISSVAVMTVYLAALYSQNNFVLFVKNTRRLSEEMSDYTGSGLEFLKKNMWFSPLTPQ